MHCRGARAEMAAQARGAVIAALVGNLLVAATKAIAAVVTGSSAMVSEAVHSFVDTGNEVLLLHGMRRARRRPNVEHPLGYGRELYFWSFIVSLLLFGVGAGVSIIQGIIHVRDPEPVQIVAVSYIVLALSLVFESGSWWVAYKGFRGRIGADGFWAAVRRSKDPPQFMVLLEDSAAILGILAALAGTWASVHMDDPRLDGVASIAIGLLLAGVSIVLARESKALLIGERADAALYKAVTDIAEATGGVAGVNGLITVQLSPDQVLVAASIEFDDELTVGDLERIVADMEARLRRNRPEVHLLFVKPQTPATFAAARERLFGPSGEEVSRGSS